jgi:hypothetical protein
VISLNDQRILHVIFEAIAHASPAHQDLRRKIFRAIAKNAKLQDIILNVLSQHPEGQQDLLQELAKSPQLRRKFFMITEDKKSLPAISKAPKKK